MVKEQSQDQVVDKRGFDYTRIEEEFIDSKDEFDIFEKVIYMVLCRHANIHTATAFPSYKTIAEKAGCSRRKAIDTVQSLVDKGIVGKKSNKNSKGEHVSNIYEILGYKNRNLYKLPPKPPKEEKKKSAPKKKADFNNFENRKYNADDIEAKMLAAAAKETF